MVYAREVQMQSHTVSNASKAVNFFSREGWGLSWSFKVCKEDVNEKVASEMAGKAVVCYRVQK